MNVPLILNASPSAIRYSPVVWLMEGDWTFQHDARDTKLLILGKSIDEPVFSSKGESVKLESLNIGTEETITVIARLIRS